MKKLLIMLLILSFLVIPVLTSCGSTRSSYSSGGKTSSGYNSSGSNSSGSNYSSGSSGKTSSGGNSSGKIAASSSVPKKEPAVGMTTDELLASTWGAPVKKSVNENARSGKLEIWYYDSTYTKYVFISNGKVTNIFY